MFIDCAVPPEMPTQSAKMLVEVIGLLSKLHYDKLGFYKPCHHIRQWAKSHIFYGKIGITVRNALDAAQQSHAGTEGGVQRTSTVE